MPATFQGWEKLGSPDGTWTPRRAPRRRDGVRATPGADRRRRGEESRSGAVSDSGAGTRSSRREPDGATIARARVGRGGGRRAGGDAAAGAPDQGPRHRRARARRRRRRLDSGPARAFRLSRVRRARGLSAAAHRGGPAYAAARDGERDSRRAECRGQTRARSRGPIPARRSPAGAPTRSRCWRRRCPCFCAIPRVSSRRSRSARTWSARRARGGGRSCSSPPRSSRRPRIGRGEGGRAFRVVATQGTREAAGDVFVGDPSARRRRQGVPAEKGARGGRRRGAGVRDGHGRRGEDGAGRRRRQRRGRRRGDTHQRKRKGGLRAHHRGVRASLALRLLTDFTLVSAPPRGRSCGTPCVPRDRNETKRGGRICSGTCSTRSSPRFPSRVEIPGATRRKTRARSWASTAAGTGASARRISCWPCACARRRRDAACSRRLPRRSRAPRGNKALPRRNEAFPTGAGARLRGVCHLAREDGGVQGEPRGRAAAGHARRRRASRAVRRAGPRGPERRRRAGAGARHAAADGDAHRSGCPGAGQAGDQVADFHGDASAGTRREGGTHAARRRARRASVAGAAVRRASDERAPPPAVGPPTAPVRPPRRVPPPRLAPPRRARLLLR